VKWYIPEAHHERARALRDDFLDGQFDLSAPAVMPFEAANALHNSGYYDGERLVEAVKSLGEYGIDLVPFGSVGPLAEIMNAVEITAYDAAYVALAVKLDAPAYTADPALLANLEGSEYEGRPVHIKTYE